MPSDDDALEGLFGTPHGPLVESYKAVHEMFLSLVAAGFTESQAIKYIVVWTIEASERLPDVPPEGP